MEGEEESKRSHVMKKEKANLEVRRNFFTLRAERLWNRLAEWVKQAESINSFKNAYGWRKGETRTRRTINF